MEHQDTIRLRSVRTNNLNGFDIDIPLSKFTVVTGKSGSGKSSLVFDTLYGEAYRRYVESLSSYARQYMKALPKPSLESVENLPAAIAVKQSKSGHSNRSSVGTLTEIIDLLRVIFTHLSKVTCCGKEIVEHSPKTIADDLLANSIGESVLFLADLSVFEGMAAETLKKQLFEQGFSRVLVDEKVVKLDEPSLKHLKGAMVVVNRLKVDPERKSLLMEAADLSLKLGQGKVFVKTKAATQMFSSQLECDICGSRYPKASLQLFNSNSPLGACETCQGFGKVAILDREKIIPNLDESLATEGVVAWNFAQHRSYYRYAIESAKKRGISAKTPFSEYTKADMEWLYRGDEKKTAKYKGIQGYFDWLATKKYKAHFRIHSARFHKYVLCPECEGSRYNRLLKHYLIDGRTIMDASRLTLKNLHEWLAEMRDRGACGADQKNEGLGDAFNETIQRLSYLNKIGIHYLHLERPTNSLSGGEIQRINMARSLGSNLTDTLFCLDEPSSGLHPRDSQNLLEIIYELRDQGNTVVVVEHEKGLIEGADEQVIIGPKAGSDGGQLVFQGKPGLKLKEKPIDWVTDTRSFDEKQFIHIKDSYVHNLKGLSAKLPYQGLTVVCGVSGSGKTSLVRHSLFPLVNHVIGKQSERIPKSECAGVTPKKLLETFADVVLVSQEGLSRSSRSNIATYLGVYSEIRKLMSQTLEAKVAKLGPGAFSFNVKGGRCETCKGLGLVEEDLSFLGSMKIVCPECKGLRFREEVLNIKYRGKNLTDLLAMTVSEARDFFFDNKQIRKVLDTVEAVGMDYMTLGQSTSSFSGGEAQRLKILSFLLENKDAEPRLFIFDEPTTGLSDSDVAHLLAQFRMLQSDGHTIVVVEHHHGVIRAADWVIEIGPEAASEGGELVFQGTPEELLQSNTITSKFLERLGH